MPDARILVVEDDADQRDLVVDILRQQEFAVEHADGVAPALEIAKTGPFDLVISDFKLGERDGLELLKELRSQENDAAFVLITAYGSIAHAVDAIRNRYGTVAIQRGAAVGKGKPEK